MALTKINANSYTTLDATKLTGNLPAISGASLTGISGGKVSQVKEFHYTTYLSKTDSSSFDDGLHVDITPSSTSSKVLVLSVGNLSKNGVTEAVYRLFRQTGGSGDSGWTTSATRVATDVGAWSGNTSADRMVAGNVFWLDSPNTTSAIRYVFGWTTYDNGVSVQLNNYNAGGSAGSQIVAMEILA